MATACQSIPPHYPGPPTPELKTSGCNSPKTAGACGPSGPGGWWSKPGAMLRRRERTARWRRAREGAEHLPSPEGQAQRTAAKCYRGQAFSSALSKMEDSWRPTAPMPARGVRRERCRASSDATTQPAAPTAGGQTCRAASSASACGYRQATLASLPSTESGSIEALARNDHPGEGDCWQGSSQPSSPNQAAGTWGSRTRSPPPWSKRIPSGPHGQSGAWMQELDALQAQGLRDRPPCPWTPARLGGSRDLPVPCPTGLQGHWADEGAPSPQLGLTLPTPPPRDDPWGSSPEARTQRPARGAPAPAPRCLRTPTPTARPRFSSPPRPRHPVSGPPTTRVPGPNPASLVPRRPGAASLPPQPRFPDAAALHAPFPEAPATPAAPPSPGPPPPPRRCRCRWCARYLC